MPNHRTVALSVLLLSGFGVIRVSAWGDAGHRIVCQIAMERLTEAGKSLVVNIEADLAFVGDPFAADCPPNLECARKHPDDGRSMSFATGCVWADESRRDTFKDTYENHFVNVSKVFTTLDIARDCAALDCALVGIQRNARYIVIRPEGSREKERRVLALRFLGHFVGDMHQPLHLGFVEDAGGNLINVKWDTGNGSTVIAKLHSVWDDEIMRRGGINGQADAIDLNNAITAAQLTAWQTFDIKIWATESYEIARTKAYAKRDGTPVAQGDVLADDYFEDALPLVKEQLQKAGVRLAHLINAAAAGTLPVNMIRLD